MSRVKLAGFAAVMALGVSVPASAQPLYNWSGYYVGAHAGKVFGSGEATPFETSPGEGYNGFGDTWTFDVDGGGNFGGQAGYNLQRNNLVYGVEIDFGQFGFEGSGQSAVSADTIGSSEGGFGFGARARVGYATGRYLIYGTGGILSVGTNASIVDDCDDGECGGATIDADGSARRTAGIFGAGVEYALSTGGRYQISVKGEFLMAAFGDYRTEVTGADNFDEEQSWDVDTESAPGGVFRVGVNIRFP